MNQVSLENMSRGIAFPRYVKALAAAHGRRFEALEIAEKWRHSTPRVITALQDDVTDSMVTRALQSPGTTADADWAAPLVNYRILIAEFIDSLRARTILGRLQGTRRVPLGIKFLKNSGVASVGWIGEGVAAPVGELDLSVEALGLAKAAGVIVATEELVRSSTPEAEGLFAAELRAALITFFDVQFISPAVSAVANVSPASITNGAFSVASSGSSVTQIIADFTALFDAVSSGSNMAEPTLIMSPASAIALALKRDSSGGPAFPGITVSGGSLFGVPVLTSASVPGSVSGGTIVVLLDASEIIVADPGLVTVDVSNEAALQMRDDPLTGAQQLVSLWQLNLAGVRCVRYGNWKRRRDAAVAYIDNIDW